MTKEEKKTSKSLIGGVLADRKQAQIRLIKHFFHNKEPHLTLESPWYYRDEDFQLTTNVFHENLAIYNCLVSAHL